MLLLDPFGISTPTRPKKIDKISVLQGAFQPTQKNPFQPTAKNTSTQNPITPNKPTEHATNFTRPFQAPSPTPPPSAARMQKTARPRKTAQEIVEEAHHDNKDDRQGDNEWRPKKCDLHIVGLNSGGIHSSRYVHSVHLVRGKSRIIFLTC